MSGGIDSPRRREFGDRWGPPPATPPDQKQIVKVVFTRRRVSVNIRRKKGRDGNSR